MSLLVTCTYSQIILECFNGEKIPVQKKRQLQTGSTIVSLIRACTVRSIWVTRPKFSPFPTPFEIRNCTISRSCQLSSILRVSNSVSLIESLNKYQGKHMDSS